MRDSLRRSEHQRDQLVALRFDMPHSRHEREIVVERPLEFHYRSRIVANGKVDAFLFVNYTVTKVHLILLIIWKVL